VTTTYSLTSVTDANGCVAITPSGTPTVTVIPVNIATTSGNWSNTSTWSTCGVVPVNISDVTIPSGVTITLDVAAPTINSLTFTGGGKLQLGANSITVTGATTGDAAVGYVVTDGVGQLKSPIGANATKTFPIGPTASSYDPLSITPTNAVTFGAYVKDVITNTLGDRSGSTDFIVKRAWEITPSATPGATTLAFTPDALATNAAGGSFNFATPTAGIMGHWNGSAWDDYTTAYVAGTRTWTLAGYTGTYSPFIVSSPGAVLAVDFTTINAQAKGTTNVVNFTTATEKDVKEFAIERSINNKEWEVIGTTAAIGGSTAANYSFTDNTPTTLAYYRVRSIENNGKGQISKVVAVKRAGGKLALVALSPMPTTEVVTVDFSVGKTNKVNVIVTDIIGKVVKTETFTTAEGANSIRLNLSNLAQGTYIMTINDGETTATQRIVKQ
jgi:hypothetical protein